MVNEMIVEGLKQALVRGEPLNRAMMSFYNAGYEKQEVEEAANFLQMPSIKQQPQQQTQEQFLEKPKEETNDLLSMVETENKSHAQMQNYQQVQQMQRPSMQRVSNYGGDSSTEKIAIIILIFFLLLLVGMLATIFFFKQELIDFFNKMFS